MRVQKGKFKHQEVLGKEVFYLLFSFFMLSFWEDNNKNHLGIQHHRNGPRISFLKFVYHYNIFAKASQKLAPGLMIFYISFVACLVNL